MAGELSETTIGDVCQVFDGPHATRTRRDADPVFLGITTHTAMAGTHRPEKWPAFADTTRDGLSTRRAGTLVEVSHKTAWRWWHKVIAFLAPITPPPLSGIVEADETYFRRNCN